MKYILLLLLTAFFGGAVQAQENDLAKQFIQNVITDKKLIYTDSIDRYTLHQMRVALNKDTVNSTRRRKPDTPLVFSKEERAYINHELDKMQNQAWPTGLLDSSKLVKQEIIAQIFRLKPKTKTDAWQYFYKHYGAGFYDFSKPLFLRNNTLCIFYKGYHCGWLCAEGDLTIYIKREGRWVAWYTPYRWIS